jgi:hypothetical protein
VINIGDPEGPPRLVSGCYPTLHDPSVETVADDDPSDLVPLIQPGLPVEPRDLPAILHRLRLHTSRGPAGAGTRDPTERRGDQEHASPLKVSAWTIIVFKHLRASFQPVSFLLKASGLNSSSSHVLDGHCLLVTQLRAYPGAMLLVRTCSPLDRRLVLRHSDGVVFAQRFYRSSRAFSRAFMTKVDCLLSPTWMALAGVGFFARGLFKSARFLIFAAGSRLYGGHTPRRYISR